MSLHAPPFTPAKVFSISLGGLNFPHVLLSSSSCLPRASHNKPMCLGGGEGWCCWNVHRICVCLLFISPSLAPVAGAKGLTVQVTLVCLWPAPLAWGHGTFLSALPFIYCSAIERLHFHFHISFVWPNWTSLVAQTVKHLSTMRETWGRVFLN